MTSRLWQIAAEIKVIHPEGFAEYRNVPVFIIDGTRYAIRHVEDAERWGRAVVMTGDVRGTVSIHKITARPLYV